MQGKIALEEHFAVAATLSDSQVFGAHVWSELGPRLTDFQDKRLRLMDASGVEIMILSLNAPAVQAIWDVKRAIHVAREANDVLAAEIKKLGYTHVTLDLEGYRRGSLNSAPITFRPRSQTIA